MATASSAWIGQPSTPNTTISDREREYDTASQLASMGYAQSNQAQQRTGVDAGQGGYVSGQVAPTPIAPVVAPAPTGTGFGVTNPVSATSPIPSAANGAVPTANLGSTRIGAQSPQPGPTTGPGTRVPVTTAPADDIETRVSALSAPGTTTSTGTTQGKAPVPTGSSASPTVWAGKQLGIDLPDPGGDFLKPSVADLSPTINAQNAAFGTAGNIDLERYNYRPGEAASQTRVALDEANANQTRGGQLDALGRLKAAATGAVPSVAELQLRSQAAKNAAANLGAARALGGRSAGGVAHAATTANAASALDTNAAAAQLRAQELSNARNQEIAALSGVRGQDVSTAEANANLAQAANKANLDSQLEQNKLADQHRMALLDAQLKAMGIGTTAAGSTVATSKANADAENQNKKDLANMASSILAF